MLKRLATGRAGESLKTSALRGPHPTDWEYNNNTSTSQGVPAGSARAPQPGRTRQARPKQAKLRQARPRKAGPGRPDPGRVILVSRLPCATMSGGVGGGGGSGSSWGGALGTRRGAGRPPRAAAGSGVPAAAPPTCTCRMKLLRGLWDVL
ncbi:unnamed protein product [Lampetra planeri]